MLEMVKLQQTVTRSPVVLLTIQHQLWSGKEKGSIPANMMGLASVFRLIMISYNMNPNTETKRFVNSMFFELSRFEVPPQYSSMA